MTRMDKITETLCNKAIKGVRGDKFRPVSDTANFNLFFHSHDQRLFANRTTRVVCSRARVTASFRAASSDVLLHFLLHLLRFGVLRGHQALLLLLLFGRFRARSLALEEAALPQHQDDYEQEEDPDPDGDRDDPPRDGPRRGWGWVGGHCRYLKSRGDKLFPMNPRRLASVQCNLNICAAKFYSSALAAVQI